MIHNHILSAADLNLRGWTSQMISNILGSPKVSGKSQKRRERLFLGYILEDVVQAEKSDIFQENILKKSRQIARCREAANKRRMILIHEANTIDLAINLFDSQRSLEQFAKRNHRTIEEERRLSNLPYEIIKDPDQEQINRMCVNMLRHHCAQYINFINKISGKRGATEAYSIIKERVLNYIAQTYPHLLEECQKQINKIR